MGSASGTAVLALGGVHHGYQRGAEHIAVLAGADLTVHTGEHVAIVGRSGSGKSTLLHIAGGLCSPAAGTVAVQGTDLAPLSPTARAVVRRRAVGFVFQAFHLLAGLTVAENVALPLLLDGVAAPGADRRARAALGALGLADRGDHLPGELSGGQLQRAAIARALVAQPPLILADEPTGNLDATTAEEVVDVLVGTVREAGAALVIVTHDTAIASRADRVLALADGALA